jgi:Asp-tRNA(Asn)/Glu-tRNA(Gln) amidotransferase A subunit family amidase
MQYSIDPFIQAVELAAAIRRKEVSPVEVVDSYLERMDKLDPRLNAFCHRADDDVRKPRLPQPPRGMVSLRFAQWLRALLTSDSEAARVVHRRLPTFLHRAGLDKRAV